ncbi:MAG: hypothetical protein IPO05_12340 [Flavobacteriales bacterium]|jgi:hypothetical protein|nr:hypothetical protein [Flavobacteriales bacterium]MBK9514377.1 hypothetical protein [Flavobacteriales bacterium]MBP7449233.1 hypothetical protein [Flavobacteriales bacterium]HOZ40262.1 DUF5706 domain-containing protein [Flavobacteriales bacterium]
MSQQDPERPPAEPILGPLQATSTRSYEDVDPYTADHRDYLLIQSRVNLMAVSQMSDLKANLILTLSAVMLQFALVKALDGPTGSSSLTYWSLAIGSLVTIALCAWSTIPKTPLRFTEMPDDGSQGPLPNLLHFSTFNQLPLTAFKRQMNHVMRSPPHTHEAILEEIHAHGRYIARRKYLPLRLAYITFLLTWLIGAALYLTGS